jgi:hypothetical protein
MSILYRKVYWNISLQQSLRSAFLVKAIKSPQTHTVTHSAPHFSSSSCQNLRSLGSVQASEVLSSNYFPLLPVVGIALWLKEGQRAAWKSGMGRAIAFCF